VIIKVLSKDKITPLGVLECGLDSSVELKELNWMNGEATGEQR